MANRPSTRKRVCAIRRGPDGSAFQKWYIYGYVEFVYLFVFHISLLFFGFKFLLVQIIVPLWILFRIMQP